MTSTTMNISLSEKLKEKIQNRISDGTFSNSSDYVRHLIRSDIDKQAEQQKLAKLIQAGIDSGMSEKSGKQIFSELREYIKNKSS